MDSVLFVREAAHFESMELERVEEVCGVQSCSRPRYGPPEEIVSLARKSGISTEA